MNGGIDKLVVVVDSDSATRQQTAAQVAAAGFPTREYASGEELLAALQQLDRVSHFCVISEMDLPGISGPLLQQQLNSLPHVAKIVFYVRAVRLRHVVRVMRDGAVAVVEKGEGVGGLLDFVEEAVERSRVDHLHSVACNETMEELKKLSSGEQEVLRGIMAGKLNKEIAQELSLSIRTIEQRRREVFRKLHVQHPAPLACKVMEFAQAHELRPELHGDESTRWLTDRRHEGPVAAVGWRRRQALWARHTQ